MQNDKTDFDAKLHGPPSEDKVRSRLAEEMCCYLASQGIPERKQAAHVAALTGLSIMQARRKLNGIASWSIDECTVIARHHGCTVDEMLSLSRRPVERKSAPCEVQIGRHWYAGSVEVGQISQRPKTGDLIAYETERCWKVVPFADVVKEGVNPVYGITGLSVDTSACSNVRIAVLDDDVEVAKTVSTGLTASGFISKAFTQLDEVTEEVAGFDVFIIDFFLDGGRTATSLIETVRRTKPDALIIVLTGYAREGVDEELAHQIRFFKVQMFEKPARIAYFESAIEAWMDIVQRP